MKIYGLQKMTLLDYPGHVACTVFLGGCDFRCPFCHNYDLACGRTEAVMDLSGLTAFLRKRRGLLDGVAVTGGEPCIHQDLPELLSAIQSLGFRTKLDTNGYHPDMLKEILDNDLADYVAMDIKNSPEKYTVTAGIRDIDPGRIRKSISLLLEERTDYEFRTTVVRELHQESDFTKIGEMISGCRRYYLQPFADRDSIPFDGFHAPEAETLRRYAEIMGGYAREVSVRGV